MEKSYLTDTVLKGYLEEKLYLCLKMLIRFKIMPFEDEFIIIFLFREFLSNPHPLEHFNINSFIYPYPLLCKSLTLNNNLINRSNKL